MARKPRSAPKTVNKASYVLPESLTIDNVEAVAEALKKIVPSPAFTLDASRTETITTPGVQLLLSCARMFEMHGTTLSIARANPHFSDYFEQLGLMPSTLNMEISYE